MAEKKTTKKEEVKVPENMHLSDKVVEKIVAGILKDVKGVLGPGIGFFGEIADAFSASSEPDFTKGIGVKINGQSIDVDIKIIVEAGQNIPDIVTEITKKSKAELKKVTGIETDDICVEVSDTMTKEEFDDKYMTPPVIPMDTPPV